MKAVSPEQAVQKLNDAMDMDTYHRSMLNPVESICAPRSSQT